MKILWKFIVIVLWKFLAIVTCIKVFEFVLIGMTQSKYFMDLYKYPIIWHIFYVLNVLASLFVSWAVYCYYYRDDIKKKINEK